MGRKGQMKDLSKAYKDWMDSKSTRLLCRFLPTFQADHWPGPPPLSIFLTSFGEEREKKKGKERDVSGAV